MIATDQDLSKARALILRVMVERMVSADSTPDDALAEAVRIMSLPAPWRIPTIDELSEDDDDIILSGGSF